ncbi:histidine phosphatase family protein [Streptomyces sp. NPDC020192]|uniref:histidine phosphatase family protein n=1 Tax=Streptomyces sp. NPDC020192 TaxID=3365066 RepID=UPI0037BA70A1
MPASVRRTRLVLIRHAEARANVEGVLGGHHGCTGLTPRGREQAEALRGSFLASGELADAELLLTSLLPRAAETAQLIAPAVGNGSLPVLQRCDLCDVHWGQADGGPAADLPEVRSPYVTVASGAESWLGFSLRCRRALRSIARAHQGRTTVIVTHGGVIKESLKLFGGPSTGREAEPEIRYASVTSWISRDGTAPWRLERLNELPHQELPQQE